MDRLEGAGYCQQWHTGAFFQDRLNSRKYLHFVVRQCSFEPNKSIVRNEELIICRLVFFQWLEHYWVIDMPKHVQQNLFEEKILQKAVIFPKHSLIFKTKIL